MGVAHKVNGERVVVLGWGRAILLQLAHPLVAAGVSQHSQFSGGRLTRLERLHATVGAMLDLTFGPPERADRTAARINAIHRRVNGFLDEGTPRFPAGTPYTATDPALLLWVHATLLDSMPLAYEHFVGPLSMDEKDAYCLESAASAVQLGVPEEMLPVDSAGVQRCVDAAVGEDLLAVTAAARRVARHLLYPPLADPTRPGAWLNRLVTLGLLPPRVRKSYGFPWTGRHERSFRLTAAAIRRLLPLTPSVVRYWAAARR